ncbi:hypothetical protein IWZ03DRAFT_145345 [Phyllosticta citriasiana]|uniref:Secreted protein n=1 Tax=Phyllosticta citriasiana TaxID=595635 RepID=A0ABR1KT76_9PEZI
MPPTRRPMRLHAALALVAVVVDELSMDTATYKSGIWVITSWTNSSGPERRGDCGCEGSARQRHGQTCSSASS